MIAMQDAMAFVPKKDDGS